MQKAMRKAVSYYLPLVVPLLFLMSCSAPPLKDPSATVVKDPLITVVKFPRMVDDFAPTEWVPYQVLRTNAIYPDSLMKVTVGGAVRYPGSLQIPKGATLLEAIAKAGGFIEYAYTRHIHVNMPVGPEKDPYRLYRHLRNGQAWYGYGMGDYVLQPDTVIHVSWH